MKSHVISVEVASLQEMNKESNKGQIFFKDTWISNEVIENVDTKKTTHHGHVGVAGKQFQVDLLVDHSFGVGVEIQPDLRPHLAFLGFLV